MRKVANCIHHTHWDPFWFFTPQDVMVQNAYNMKELMDALESGQVREFFMDGQTACVDEYLSIYPEDRERIKKLVEAKKFIIGPFNSQLDCFISSGESVINNLLLAFDSANKLGGVSKIAYLPDSFGHSSDFPKIFNQMGIHDFVITRGVGDQYDLGSEFYWQSNDGSKVLVCVMLAGYGYGCYAFRDGSIVNGSGEDYNKRDIEPLIELLLSKTTIPNEFVYPLGFDQNPAILDIGEKIEKYNAESKDLFFRLTTWEEFMARVRKEGIGIKTHKGEIMATQYHRMHKSMYSARSDIKYLQDICERTLTFLVPPLMSMADGLGLPYEPGLITKAWDMLVKCQTHGSATVPDDTNAWIKDLSQEAVNLAKGHMVYLIKNLAINIPSPEQFVTPLVIYNTLPVNRKVNMKMEIYTKYKNFKLIQEGEEISYKVLERESLYTGVKRKDPALMTEDKYLFKTTVAAQIGEFYGLSYKTIYVHEYDSPDVVDIMAKLHNSIENDRYKIELDRDGIHVSDKKLGRTIKRAVYIEESGDEGDNYDFSYPNPDEDMLILHHFENASVTAYNVPGMSEMTVTGSFTVPANLKSRKLKSLDTILKYSIRFRIKDDNDTIELKGTFTNDAKAHRVRIVFSSDFANTHSYAGTQFGYIKRDTDPPELKIWKEQNWFEEPSPTNPLLNHVSAVGELYTLSAFTRSIKEYEFIGNGKKDIALCIFRSVGHMGLPDLNRRPGRPSGLDYAVYDAPTSQMIGDVNFEIGFTYYASYDANVVMNDYVLYATDVLYYQNQQYYKTVFPSSYFPTNPLHFEVPHRYSHIELCNSEASFGAFYKSRGGNGYILRVYNSENKEINGGSLKINFKYSNIYNTNILEDTLTETNEELGILKPGELRNILIVKA